MNLTRLITPRSIAVIGVSRDAEKLGTRIYRNILRGGFRGSVYPVNPHLSTIGTKRAYPDIAALPRTVDLALIVTPAPTVAPILAACGKRGIRNVIVISAGFGEQGTAGVARERELSGIARRYRINLLGPNCLGVLTSGTRLNASFAEPLGTEGGVTLISQSGAMAVALTDRALRSGVGFRSVVSMGNKAGVDEVDLLEHFRKDPKTKVILLYLESMTRGEAFVAAARRTVRRKPVIVLKAGESALGLRAAHSHTGALAAPTAVLNAALAAAGVLQVHRIEELFDCAVAFSCSPVPAGNRTLIVTNAGGPGILATDALSRTTLRLAQLAPVPRAALQRRLPSSASLENPIDVIGDAPPARFRAVLTAAMRDHTVDAVILILTPQVMTNPVAVARIAAVAAHRGRKPILASFLGGALVERAREQLRRQGIAHFDYPEDAVSALQQLWSYAQIRHRVPQVIGRRRTPTAHGHRRVASLFKGARTLLPATTHRMLASYGFRTVRERFAHTHLQVPAAARSLGFPVVLKVMARSALHKTDRGGVWTNIPNAAALAAALRAANSAFPASALRAEDEGWLVQRFLPGRVEVFLGARRDPSFGPLLLVGIGGVDVEQRAPIMVFPPFDRASIARALAASSLRAFLLHRRAAPPADLPAVVDAATHLGRLLLDWPQIADVDVNPLLVGERGTGATVVDARIYLAL